MSAAEELPKLVEVRKAARRLKATAPAQAEVADYTVTRIVNRSGRVVKTVDADGNVTGEKPLALAVASILAKHNLEVEYEDLKAKREQQARDQARREQGLPDLCDFCGAELRMSAQRISRRDLAGHPWRCVRWACRNMVEQPRPEFCDCCEEPLSMSASSRAYRREEKVQRCGPCTQKIKYGHDPLANRRLCRCGAQKNPEAAECLGCRRSRRVKPPDECKFCQASLSNTSAARSMRRRKSPDGPFACRGCAVARRRLRRG